MRYSLSLLDKSPIPDGASAAEALANTVALARRAEALGYARFWVAEHHGSAALAGSAPEILVATILAHTSQIRVGSGGVMLQHYSPFKVAEQFRVLSALAPGRVDLGVGKAPGGLPRSTRALQSRAAPAPPDDFAERLAELDAFIGPGIASDHELAGAEAKPDIAIGPERILLGGSPASAQLAARQGWQFCYAGHFNGDPENVARTVEAYRTLTGRPPMMAVFAIAAPTEERADALRRDITIYKVHLRGGRAVNLGTIEAAETFARESGVADYVIEQLHPHSIIGTQDQVRDELDQLAGRYGIEEIVVDIPAPAFADRLATVDLLATEQRRLAA